MDSLDQEPTAHFNWILSMRRTSFRLLSKFFGLLNVAFGFRAFPDD